MRGGREWNAGTGEKHVLSDNPALRTPAEEPAAAWPIRRTVSGRIVVACGRNVGRRSWSAASPPRAIC